MSIDPVSQFLPAALDATVVPTAVSPTAQSGDKFRTLMEHAVMAPPEDANGHLSRISKVVEAQDEQFQRTLADLGRLSGDVPGLSLTQITDRAIQTMFEVTSMEMNMQVKISLAESSKSAVETLMKNQ
ncbi:hypothetical protein [Burkholderia territorii]|nr:hypothetical protein [Burkholderia territorii]